MQAFDLEGAIEQEKNVDEELRDKVETLNSLESEIRQSNGLKERTIENLNQVVKRRNESVAGPFLHFYKLIFGPQRENFAKKNHNSLLKFKPSIDVKNL